MARQSMLNATASYENVMKIFTGWAGTSNDVTDTPTAVTDNLINLTDAVSSMLFENSTFNETLGPSVINAISKAPRPARSFSAIFSSTTQYKVAMFIMLYKFALLCPLSVIGNGLCFAVLIKRAQTVSSYVFMSVLALADMFSIICQTIVTAVLNAEVFLTPVGCKFISFFMDGPTVFASWLVVAMTVERLLVIWFPLKLRDWCTVRKARWTCFLIFITVMAFMAHYWWSITALPFRSNKNRWYCNFRMDLPDVRKHWGIIYAAFYSWFPFICLLVLNIGLVVGMVRITKQRAKLKNTGSNNEQLIRVTKMAFLVSLTFVILTGPFAVLLIITYTKSWNYLASAYIYADYLLIQNVFLLLLGLNNCVNVFLYFLSGRSFREELKRVISCGRWEPKDRASVAKTATTGVASSSQDFTSKI